MPREDVGRLARRLWIAFAIFVVYGTIIPFHFSGGSAAVAERLAHVHLNPLLAPDGRRASITDMVQNVLLFVPFGVLGLLARPKRGSVLMRIILVTALALALSSGVEAVQLLTIDRTTSLNDVATNALGAFAGAVGASVGEGGFVSAVGALAGTGLIDAAAFYPLLLAVVMVCIAAWEPFDVSIDVSTVFGKLKMLRHDLWQYNGLLDEGISLIHNALLAAAATAWFRSLRVRRASLAAAAVLIPLVYVLEASQLFITSRMPGLEDAAVASAGIVIGLALWAAAQHIETRWGWVALVGFATASAAAMDMLNPFEFTTAPAAFAWVPFEAYYIDTTFDTLGRVIEIWLLYAPLGYFLGRACRNPARALLAAGVVSLVIATPIEIAQHWIAGRYPDVTTIAMSVGGACIGAWAATSGARIFAEFVSDTKSAAVTS